MNPIHGLRIHITGVVQGVGFRPFVYGLATRIGLTGWVRNTSAGVDIEVDGTETQLEEFLRTLSESPPPLARIDSLQADRCPPNGFSAFEIVHSEPVPGSFVPISPDVAICDDCLRELFDPSDHRYLYPFINCTNCGPRFTIIKDIPYDRPKTTMAPFEMCAFCRAEYEDPLNRRFHAQPVACPVCGPRVWLERAEGKRTKSAHHSTHDHHLPTPSSTTIAEAQHLLAEGKILAIKGLGGFHLACDATNPKAVAELRQRKLRVDKPFALMMPDIETVEQHCYLTQAERELLLSRERPIVLLLRRRDSNITPAVAPNQNTLGVMLPYTPLHYLLFASLGAPEADDQGTKTVNWRQEISDSENLSPIPRPPSVLVMTSGNLSEEPIAYTNEDARERLRPLADAFLMHNRAIHMRCDDSVVRITNSWGLGNKASQSPHHKKTKAPVYPLRRSRGYAPNPVQLPWEDTPQILATGPELKNTFCLTKGRYAFLSHHIGDLENYETLQSFEEGIAHFERLFRITPKAIACDRHPDYLATRYALARSQSTNLPLLQIQHHHAHIASCMADNGLRGERPVIGVAFDGTGYGDDGAIWGGEFLIADYRGYQRFAHLEYTPLPGGDTAIRNPARIALAYLWQAGIPWEEALLPTRFLCGDDLKLLRSMLEHNVNCPLTSSVGRLFDAVAALAGVRGEVNYEAQAAIEFEALADPDVQERYTFEMQTPLDGDQASPPSSPVSLATNTLLREIIADIHNGEPLPSISAKFHNGLAFAILQVCEAARTSTGIGEIALSGGVWQNMTLLSRTVPLLVKSGFKVFVHRQVPANDGGLALGQAAIATQAFQR